MPPIVWSGGANSTTHKRSLYLALRIYEPTEPYFNGEWVIANS